MKIITIEEHFSSPKISEKMKQFQPKNADAEKDKDVKALIKHYLPTNEDIEDVGARRLKFMDESGIDMQVISYGSGSPQGIADPKMAIELCAEANEELACLIKQNPTRFAGFTTLPVVYPVAAAAELERAVKDLGFKGALLAGTFQGKFFDDPMFFPIFEKAAHLNVPIYLHPGIIDKKVADYYFKNENWPNLVNGIFPTSGFGWHMDSGIHVLRMILSGIFDKLPNLKLISGHWGEFVPFFLERMDEELGAVASHLKCKISQYYKENVYITPSGIFSETQLQFAIAQVGADHIIYSGDYPYLMKKETGDFLKNASISEEDKAKIGHLNVEKLLNL
ncbi:amidohydrolase family protein [Flavobacterium hungaricum]|uniref:Amidohydrolase n=1 Tax=Flavobacterium hungaricum TaxID=2082725 RepID=A0ABR9TI63_9FLAO|nr:amidohydrolase family protein [Flavobacterium hungaricum]MBE8725039.1 amidohydrolase [Flavobacterium hungaricum]